MDDFGLQKKIMFSYCCPLPFVNHCAGYSYLFQSKEPAILQNRQFQVAMTFQMNDLFSDSISHLI